MSSILHLLPITALVLGGCMSGDIVGATKSTLSASEAGSLFGEICIDHWPDVGMAQQAVQRDLGLVFDASSGLFVHPARELRMRINEDRCAIQYLTDTQRDDIVMEFAEASTPSENGERARRADGENIQIGYDDEGSGLTRASGIREK